jgi:hypothetical protein
MKLDPINTSLTGPTHCSCFADFHDTSLQTVASRRAVHSHSAAQVVPSWRAIFLISVEIRSVWCTLENSLYQSFVWHGKLFASEPETKTEILRRLTRQGIVGRLVIAVEVVEEDTLQALVDRFDSIPWTKDVTTPCVKNRRVVWEIYRRVPHHKRIGKRDLVMIDVCDAGEDNLSSLVPS